ncbi:MAG: helix-turn-helix domain-containing protein [Eubacterium sp.]|nr:helix-turn-helix domain-containing protein [Eubacterium sp.]
MLQFRIQEAANLLRTTDNKITDIGSACGFQDTSYFVKRFREFKHCTPGVYRKKNSLRRFNRTEPDITPALPAAQSRNSVPCLPSRGWRQM